MEMYNSHFMSFEYSFLHHKTKNQFTISLFYIFLFAKYWNDVSYLFLSLMYINMTFVEIKNNNNISKR